MPTSNPVKQILVAAGLTLALAACDSEAKPSKHDQVKRGDYLTTVMVCGDCHTPGFFFGKPDETQKFAGSDVGFFIPNLGYFYGRNLTPDKETGLGNWSDDEIVKAIRTGERPDGRILSPNMPWRSFASLSDDDAYAIVAYLRTLKPVRREAPPPTGPDATAPAPFLAVTMPPSKSAAAAPQ
ncbi:MAG: cytochrome c [Alphaproteobacteria bacterium]|nr:cytochrome c [Alphaproteobacteria bacterium]